MVVQVAPRIEEYCDNCDWQMTPGQVRFRDHATGVVGCSRICCEKARKYARQQHNRAVLVHGMGHMYSRTGE